MSTENVPSPTQMSNTTDADPEKEVLSAATTEFPEGGQAATRTVSGAFMVVSVSLGLMNSFGIFEAQ